MAFLFQIPVTPFVNALPNAVWTSVQPSFATTSRVTTTAASVTTVHAVSVFIPYLLHVFSPLSSFHQKIFFRVANPSPVVTAPAAALTVATATSTTTITTVTAALTFPATVLTTYDTNSIDSATATAATTAPVATAAPALIKIKVQNTLSSFSS